MVLQHKLASLLLTVVTLVGAGVVTEIEMKALAENPKQVEILRNHIALAWVAGGALLGSYVGVAIRNVTGWPNISKYFAVSLCTSLAGTPYILKRWFSDAAEECFLGGFAMAVGAWVAWEIIMSIAKRVKKAAEDRGVGGVKDELLGKGTPAAPTPAEPGK